MEDVNQTADSSPAEEQVVNQEATQPAPETTEQETEQQATPTEGKSVQPQEAVDEYGVPWKNRAMEWQRKSQDVADRIPQIIEETLAKHQTNQQPVEKKYSISELEQYAMHNPEYRPWVEEQKAKIIQDSVVKSTEERFKAERKQNEAVVKKQQAEQWVATNPRYQECFTTDMMGRKMFNPQHPMTQLIGNYMNDPDVKSRPDGLAIAAKLAYADYMDMQTPKTQKTVKTLQQNLKKVQKQTMVEGGGQQNVPIGKDTFSKAREQLARTGKVSDANIAVKEYLKKIGRITE
jgi:hypothetical protein